MAGLGLGGGGLRTKGAGANGTAGEGGGNEGTLGKGGGGGLIDPKAAALAHLGIDMGSKNIRMLKKEEVETAFIQRMHLSELT